MNRLLILSAFAAVLGVPIPSQAAIPTCDIHNGMTIWYLDYSLRDHTLSHPLGVGEGVVEINEKTWHKKCRNDGPHAKVFVPFNGIKGLDKGQWDTRWPQDVYRTRAEAERVYDRARR